VDQALHAGRARQPGNPCCGLDVDGVEGRVITPLDIEADSIHGPEGAGQRRGN
jgi:hypothetical protein